MEYPRSIRQCDFNQITVFDFFFIIDEMFFYFNFRYYEMLEKLQSMQGLHLGTKITPRHVAYQGDVMKVKYATQLFSESTACALEYCLKNKIPGFENCAETIRFTRMMNRVFDVLNSKNLKETSFKKPLNAGNKSEIFGFLDEVEVYLRQLKTTTKKLKKIKDVTKTNIKTGFLGILTDISSIKSIYAR
jgi:hypothetical protein